MMDIASLKTQINAIAEKREFLVQLLERPNLGTLKIDVNQALEELDELIEEFEATIPSESVEG